MLLCYYLDVLGRFAENDIAGIKPYLAPLQKAISTPLACYIYFCVALESHSLADITTFYNDLLAHRDYLDLKSRADRAVTAWLKGQIGTSASEDVLFSSVAEKVYYRLPDATVGKYLLLLQRRKKTLDVSLLGDVMKRFPEDQGVSKIAIEYYLGGDLDFAEELIKNYETRFLQLRQDMLPYKIILAMRRSDFNGASALFQQNYSEELAGEYWTFASTTNRVDDLRFLASKHPLYRPFCEAAILLSSGKKAEALKKLAVADAKGNLQLRFYAAKTLGEHGDYHAALEHYGKIPADSPYQLAVLMNSAELQWELNNKTEALNLARRAYELAPGSKEAQHCYADKLYKSGQFEEIANVVKVIAHSPYRSKMEQFLAASLEHQLKHCDVNHDKEKILRLCSQLKRLQPNNQTAAEYLRKVHEQQQKGHSGRG